VTLEDFVARLEDVESVGDGYRARCPKHRGPRRSFAVKGRDEGGDPHALLGRLHRG
jgi:hypothetical protein